MTKTLAKYNEGNGSFSFHHSISESGTFSSVFGPESHQQFEILYLLKGDITYHIEGEKYVVNQGDAIFVPPNQIHTIHLNTKVDYERIVVLFDIEIVEKMLALCDMSLDKEVFNDTTCYRVIPHAMLDKAGIIEQINGFLQVQNQKLAQMYMLASIFKLIIKLDAVLSTKERGYVPVSVDSVVKGATAYINKNIQNTLTLDEICSAVFVSKSTLCHKFVKIMHVSVKRYVAIKKIHYASRLIKRGMSAVEAGVAVGYKQYTTFYHNYKQILGVSPAEDKRID